LKSVKDALKLYLVTDRSWSDESSFYEHIEETLINGVTFLQLREKGVDEDVFLTRAVKMKNILNKYDVPFVINDNVNVALKSGADGVHIGQGDMSVREARDLLGPEKILGVTVQTVEQAKKAEREGADYLGSGAVFSTNTKGDAKLLDHKILKNICESVSIPVVAIGGISSDNILKLKGTNVDGVAVVSAILSKENKGMASRELLELSQKMIKHEIPKVLTIAGSDCSGGAGIQADLKTMSAHGCYGMSVITALTAQNTTGVYGVENCTPEFVKNQMECIFSDIEPGAVKIGMVSSKDIINAVAEKLRLYKSAAQSGANVVLDPVMISTSGSKLLEDDAIECLINELIPLATLITPNLAEAELLSGLSIHTMQDMIQAAEKIAEYYNGHILIKGGHLEEHANDLLYSSGEVVWFEGAKIDNPNTHGTGCTLSSAIASNLAMGYSIKKSVENSKLYLTGAIADKLNIGRGRGPLNHGYLK